MKSFIKTTVLVFALMQDAQAAETLASETLVSECAKSAKDLIARISDVEAEKLTIDFLNQSTGIYSTKLTYRVHSGMLTDYEVIMFQDEEGEGCYLGKIEWIGDF